MGGEELDEDRSSLRGNSMTKLSLFGRGGHGTSLFFMENSVAPHLVGRGRKGDL